MVEMDSDWPVLGDAVHVWMVQLEAAAAGYEGAAQLLDEGESARAARFLDARLRQCFTLSHAVRRRLIGGYLGMDPRAIEFGSGEHGKPFVPGAAAVLEFNSSDSGGYAAFAFCSGGRLGVDIERERQHSDLMLVAARKFAPQEYADLMAFPEQQRAAAFLRCWTRKEAYLKATGLGLAMKLNSFEVSLTEEARFTRLNREYGDVWTLTALRNMPSGFAGAVAYAGPERELREFGLTTAGELLAGLDF